MILLGNLCFACAIAYFVLPAGILSGGCTGIAMVLNQLFGISIPYCVLFLNALLFLIGFLVMGKAFALNTLISSFAYPIFLNLTEWLSTVTGFPTEDPFLCMMFAGLIFGTGVGLILREDASTGGTDIVALLCSHHFGWSVSRILSILDAFILALQMFHSDAKRILYSLLFVLIYSIVLEQILMQGKSCIQIQIISTYYEQINQMIIAQMDSGSTLFQIEGGYTRNGSYAIQAVVSKRMLYRLRKAVLKIDPCAFIVIGQVSEVNGRGFTMGR